MNHILISQVMGMFRSMHYNKMPPHLYKTAKHAHLRMMATRYNYGSNTCHKIKHMPQEATGGIIPPQPCLTICLTLCLTLCTRQEQSIVLTGPTGSGKSTALHYMVNYYAQV